MTYLDTNARTVKPTSNENLQGIGRQPVLFGVFLGFVKRADDVQKNGRLQVWIPEFGTAPDEEQGWVTVSYCSPFAGATNLDANSKTDTNSFEGTQTSYGLWMVPPDINNQVLVMFISGDPSRGIWIGSMYNQFMNNMIPAVASDTNNYQYPGTLLPVAEYNKNDTRITQPDKAIKPVNKTKFQGVGNQGLIRDNHRGVTESGARKTSPSNVYGILTPGPVIGNPATPSDIKRKGGSSFIMDDTVGNEYIELSTKSGSKIKIDETNGSVYIINRDGTAWVEIDYLGNIDVFGGNSISLRCKKDFNIRADRNVNIEAGQNIFFKAAKDTIDGEEKFTYDINNKAVDSRVYHAKHVGEGKGTGGNIVMQALGNWHSTTKGSAYLSVIDNNLNINVNGSLKATTITGSQDFSSGKGLRVTTQGSIDLSSIGNTRIGSKGILSLTGETGQVLCTSGKLSIKSLDDTVIAAGNGIKTVTTSFDINSPVKIGSTLDVVGGIKSTGKITSTIEVSAASIKGSITDSPSPGPAASIPAAAVPAAAQTPLGASSAVRAEVKPLNEKIDILPTWEDSSNKFKRDATGVLTTVSRFITYEPCPEHTNFSYTKISRYKSVTTQPVITYEGSGTSGNETPVSPKTAEAPGVNNVDVVGDLPEDSVTTKDINMGAWFCQIKKHEGVKFKTYLDSVGLPTGGVGHLLREDEKVKYPVGSAIPESQVNTWLAQDSIISIKIAQRLFSKVWYDLSDVRRRALVDLAFNLGPNRLAKFKNFVSAVNNKDFTTAGNELRSSKWFTQVGKRGPAVITMIVSSIDPTGCDISR